MKRTISILLLFLGITLFSQQTAPQKNLLKRANENFKLLNTNPEEAFEEAIKIEKEAQNINAREAELRAIANQCAYYKSINDFKNLLITGELLLQKSEHSKDFLYQTIARMYLAENYLFLGFQDKAFNELKSATHAIQNVKSKDTSLHNLKADIYVIYANYYSQKGDLFNRFKYNKLAGGVFENLPESEHKQRALSVYYSNIGNDYNDLKILDSASYYLELSLLKENKFKRSDIEFSNLLGLGEIEIKKENYSAALLYLKKAGKIEGYKNHRNVEALYNNIILSYQKLKQKDSASLFLAKKDSLKFRISENQNKTLYNLLEEKEKDKSKSYIYLLIFFLFLVLILVYFVVKKNRNLIRQEKISQKYLEKKPKNTAEDYSKLVRVLKENDPTFMFYFEEIFPGFSSKLLQINPKISASDVEFCALIKIKIPTKDIARYRFIAPKTVLNKKYLIRNKLNIPQTADIYEWFDSF